MPASQFRPEKLGKYAHRTSTNQSGCSTTAIQRFLQQKQQRWALSVHFKRGPKISQEGKIRLQHLMFTIFYFFLFSIHICFFSFPSSSQVSRMLRASILVWRSFSYWRNLYEKRNKKLKILKKSDFAGFQ